MRKSIYLIFVAIGLVLVILGAGAEEFSVKTWLAVVVGLAMTAYGEYKLGWLFDDPYKNN